MTRAEYGPIVSSSPEAVAPGRIDLDGTACGGQIWRQIPSRPDPEQEGSRCDCSPGDRGSIRYRPGGRPAGCLPRLLRNRVRRQRGWSPILRTGHRTRRGIRSCGGLRYDQLGRGALDVRAPPRRRSHGVAGVRCGRHRRRRTCTRVARRCMATRPGREPDWGIPCRAARPSHRCWRRRCPARSSSARRRRLL